MATFRMISTDFWNDYQVLEEFTPEDKLFYLYLCTNPATKQIGIYPITKKKMAFELGYSIEVINSLMNRFKNHHKLIDYDEETREIILLKWSETAFRKGGKPVNDLLISEMNTIKRVDWIARVAPLIPIESVRDAVLAYMKENNIKNEYESYHDSYDDTPTRRKKEELRTKNQEIRIIHSVQQAELFDEWWNLYNLKIGKKKCFPVYQKLLKETSHEQIMTGTQTYIDYRKTLLKRNDFCPQQKNPLTFLNGEHFNDDYEAVLNNPNRKKSNIELLRELSDDERIPDNEAAFARTRNADGTAVQYDFIKR